MVSSPLQRANEVRLHAAQLRAEIASLEPGGGARRAIEAIENREGALRFRGLLEAVPGIGSVIGLQMLERAGINPERALQESQHVSIRQRALLIGQLLEFERTKRR